MCGRRSPWRVGPMPVVWPVACAAVRLHTPGGCRQRKLCWRPTGDVRLQAMLPRMHACVRGVPVMAEWPSPEHRSSSGACELFFTEVTLRTGLLWFVESNPPDDVSPQSRAECVGGRVRGRGNKHSPFSGLCLPTPPRRRLCAAPPPAPQSLHARRLQAAAQQQLRRLLQLRRALLPGRHPCAP